MKKNPTLFKSAILCLTLFCATLTINASVVTGTIGNVGGAYGIDFNNDGTAEFYIRDAGFDVTHTNSMLMFTWSQNGNNIWTNGNLDTGGWDDIVPLTAGTSIGANGNWEAQGDAYIVNYYDETLFPAGDSYIGFRITINGNTHYGWAKVNISGSSSSGYQVQWLQCAYESAPNTAITAGSTGVGIRDNEKPVLVYPNPTTDVVYINADLQDAHQVFVYDMSGRMVNVPAILEGETAKLDFSALQGGLYVVQFGQRATTIIKR